MEIIDASQQLSETATVDSACDQGTQDSESGATENEAGDTENVSGDDDVGNESDDDYVGDGSGDSIIDDNVGNEIWRLDVIEAVVKTFDLVDQVLFCCDLSLSYIS